MPTGPILVQFGAVLIVAVVAFTVLIRPQLKRIAQHRSFLTSLQIGDAVMTQGGLVGRIESLDQGDLVSLSVGTAMSVRIDRNCIERRYTGSF